MAVENAFITKDNKIVTADPVMNTILNMPRAEITSSKIKKIADKVHRINEKIGANVDALTQERDYSEAEENRLSFKKDYARRKDAELYFMLSDRLKAQKENTEQLRKERDSLIDSEISASDIEYMITEILAAYREDRIKRLNEIVDCLATAKELLEEQFSQGEEVERILALIQHKLNSRQGDAVINRIAEMQGGYNPKISVEESSSLMRYAHHIEEIIKNLH